MGRGKRGHRGIARTRGTGPRRVRTSQSALDSLAAELSSGGDTSKVLCQIVKQHALIRNDGSPRYCGCDAVMFPDEDAARRCRDTLQAVLRIGSLDIRPCRRSPHGHVHLDGLRFSTKDLTQ